MDASDYVHARRAAARDMARDLRPAFACTLATNDNQAFRSPSFSWYVSASNCFVNLNCTCGGTRLHARISCVESRIYFLRAFA